jgi:hypothetical protein
MISSVVAEILAEISGLNRTTPRSMWCPDKEPDPLVMDLFRAADGSGYAKGENQ